MIAVDDGLEYFFIVFSEKIKLDISCESSARQRIYMKHQAIFSSKVYKNKKIKVMAAANLFSSLSIKLMLICVIFLCSLL